MDIIINHRTLSSPHVVKLPADKVEKAMKDAKKDGVNNVFFAMGNDVYVMSGKNLSLDNMSAGNTVNFKGQTGRVLQLDEQLDASTQKKMGLVATLLGTMAGGGLGFGAGVMNEIAGVARLSTRGFAGIGAAVGALLIGGFTAFALKGQKSDEKHMSQYGEAAQ